MEAIDFNSPEFIHNPYPVYRTLREASGPYWLEHAQTNSQSPGMWLITRYDDVSDVLKGSVGISKQISRVRPPENLLPMEQTMLNQDPPEHTRLRSLVNQAFTPAQIRNLAPRIGNIVDELIARIRARGEADFVKDFAIPLPMMVLADFMGVPFEDHLTFCRWSAQILCGYDSGVKNTDNFQGYRGAIAQMGEYFNELIEKRRRHPSSDLITTLIDARDKHEKLSGDELVSMCMLLLVSGHETTTNMLSSGMLTLLKNPKQLAMLKANPDLMEDAVEEILRFESPIQRATFRITTKACTIGGKEFKEGEQISAMIGAANRDPGQFAQPDTFDITRTPNKHLAFGIGIHFCLGAYLARTEAQIGFGKIIQGLPDIRLAEVTPVWNEKKLFRGLRALHVHA
jgi:pimeloyl-[acyl-carrier protein] synthase